MTAGCKLDGNPIPHNAINLLEAAALTSEVVQDRLDALNFEQELLDHKMKLLACNRVPGDLLTTAGPQRKVKRSMTLLLPHLPTSQGLWSHALVRSGLIDQCSVLPQIEQLLLRSSSSILIAVPEIHIDSSTPVVQVLEYGLQILLRL